MMRKKLNWKEAAFLASSALVLAVSGKKMFQREWDRVPVGRFHFVVVDAKFKRLPQPQLPLMARRLKRVQPMLGITRGNLAIIQATVRLGHEGATPSWWGKSTALPGFSSSAVNGQGQGFRAIGAEGTTTFDKNRQQYVVTGEFAVPTTPNFTQEGHLLMNVGMNKPLESVNMTDSEAPIDLQPYQEHFKLPMPECLRKS